VSTLNTVCTVSIVSTVSTVSIVSTVSRVSIVSKISIVSITGVVCAVNIAGIGSYIASNYNFDFNSYICTDLWLGFAFFVKLSILTLYTYTLHNTISHDITLYCII